MAEDRPRDAPTVAAPKDGDPGQPGEPTVADRRQGAQGVPAGGGGGAAPTVVDRGPDTPGRGSRERPDQGTGAPGGKAFGGGRYEVTEVLGKGGFGTVYKAYDRNLGRHVAIKTINTQDIEPSELEQFRLLFKSEAAAAGQLDHPGVVTVYDYDPYADEPFIVMSLIEGGTLQQRLAERRTLPWREVADLGAQVADALHYAHGRGIQAHRDVKPGNVFCARDGRYKLGDFGIARRHKPSGATRSTFFAAGTPRYMPPEQIATPREVDGRTDLFALAVVLYEALTGKLPYRGVSLDFDPEEHPDSARRIVDAAFDPPAPVRTLAPEVPEKLGRAVERALHRDPRKRFKNCAEFAAALRSLDARAVEERRQWPVWAAAGVVVAALAVGGYWLRQRLVPGDDVSVARRAALGAQAQELAPELLKQADEQLLQGARDRALEMYQAAAREAWHLQLAAAGREASAKREAALRMLADTYASEALAEADAQRERWERVGPGQEADAVKGVRAAAAAYEQAGESGREGAAKDVGERLAMVDRLLEDVKELSGPAAGVAAGVERLQPLAAAGRQELEARNLGEALARLQAAENEAARLAELVATQRLDAALAKAANARREAEAHRLGPQEAQALPPELRARLAAAQAAFDQGQGQVAAGERGRDVDAVLAAIPRFEEAAETFSGLRGDVKRFAARKAALAAQEQAVGARRRAEGERAAEMAAARWQRAADQMERGERSFGGDDYEGAAGSYATAEAEWNAAAGEARAAGLAAAKAALADVEAIDKRVKGLGAATSAPEPFTRARAALESARAGLRQDRWQDALSAAGEATRFFDETVTAVVGGARQEAIDARTSAEEAQAGASREGAVDPKAEATMAEAGKLLAKADAEPGPERYRAAAEKYAAVEEAYRAAVAAVQQQLRAAAEEAGNQGRAKRKSAAGAGIAEEQLAAFDRDLASADAALRAGDHKAAKQAYGAVVADIDRAVMGAKVEAAASAVRAAEAAHGEAERAGAAVLPKAMAAFAEAKRLLDEARARTDREPADAKQRAERAAEVFAKAKATAVDEAATLGKDLERRREEATSARAAAAKAGAAQDERVAARYRKADSVFAKAESAAGAAAEPAAVVAAIRDYEASRKEFSAVEKIARLPKLEVTEKPAAGTVVSVMTGAPRGQGARFEVRSNVARAGATWQLDGAPAPGAGRSMSWEYLPPFEQSPGTRRVRVVVRDDAGSEVVKEWSVRIEAPNAAPRILALTPETTTAEVGRAIAFSARVEDADAGRGDAVTCRWLVDSADQGAGSCRWRWESPPVGSHRVEVIARDRRGQEDRLTRTLVVVAPDPKPMVEGWLRGYCAQIESNYRERLGQKAACEWRDLEISGELPTIQVSFVRVDRFEDGEKPIAKTARLHCSGGVCRER